MSRYRIAIRHVPGKRGAMTQYINMEATNAEEAALMVLDQFDYEARKSDIVCLWEGAEPMDRQLRRMGAPMLPGIDD